MKCHFMKVAPAVALAGAAAMLTPAPSTAQTTIFSEDFESVTLRTPVDETNATYLNQNVWTHIPPFGWLVDNSGVGGDGAVEWDGWSFARKDFWVTVAGDQDRSLFTRGQGIVAVADPDEYDDYRSGIPNSDRYDTFMRTPEIPLANVQPNSVTLLFDSSWLPEGFDDGDRLNNQTAIIRVSFDGGTSWTEIVRWDSDVLGDFFKPDAPNEAVTLNIANPANASNMILEFAMANADNDWWWAIDNLRVTANAVNAAGRSISGTVTVEDCPNMPVDATFVLHPSDNSGDLTLTKSLPASGQFTLENLPSKNYMVKVKTSKTLSRVVAANTTGGNVSNLAVPPLEGGDADDNNIVDVDDLNLFIQAFDADPTAPNWNANADFDCNSIVDQLDLAIFIENFDQEGENL